MQCQNLTNDLLKSTFRASNSFLENKEIVTMCLKTDVVWIPATCTLSRLYPCFLPNHGRLWRLIFVGRRSCCEEGLLFVFLSRFPLVGWKSRLSECKRHGSKLVLEHRSTLLSQFLVCLMLPCRSDLMQPLCAITQLVSKPGEVQLQASLH